MFGAWVQGSKVAGYSIIYAPLNFEVPQPDHLLEKEVLHV
jgi:hypothetical protein